MRDILTQLFGEAVTDDALKQFNAELGKKFVAKADYNGKLEEIKTLKADKTTLEGKVKELGDSTQSAKDARKELADLKAEIKKKEDADKEAAEDKALTDAIITVIGDKKFTSDYVRNGIIADMKSEIAKPENKSKGYSEIFEALTKDKEGIFVNPNPPGDMTGMSEGDLKITDNEARAVMGLPPIQ